MLNSNTVPNWTARIIREIKSTVHSQISLVIENGASPSVGSAGRLLRNPKHLLWKLYSALDYRLFRETDDPFQRVSVADELDGIPRLRVSPEMTRFRDRFPAEAIETIRGYELDVAIRFGFRILDGDVLKIARFGVWSFHHGDNEVNRGGPPGFWEVALGEPVTGSVLQILSSNLDAGRVIYRSWSSTHPYSVVANQTRFYYKSAAFIGRKLRDLAQQGETALKCIQCDSSQYRPYFHPLYQPPSNRQMMGFLFRLGARGMRAMMQNAFHRGAWKIAYKISKSSGLPTRLHDFKPLIPPKDRVWADPFPVSHDGKRYIFVEEALHRFKNAHISVLEMNEDGSWKPPAKVLQRPYHLSYPFVFRWNQQFYMIPETKGNNSVELYRATNFPHDWTLEKVLLENVKAVDATVEEIDGRWWMFVGMAERGAPFQDELHLYYADSPLGPWQAHPRNPVKSDVRSARPAGRLFQYGNEWYRPAQDGSVRYGYAITLNQITKITSEEFDEEEISKILPKWRKGLMGTHTFNHHAGLTVVDEFYYRPRIF
ncbi:MAG TPA: hypothetical protein PKA76_03825 [Pirellulaceae bacterium]|nr:hypothetical protein [Pirellulaceae bacterium]HMP68455.1 hypothetical protein [Pirellulaceae bacterium]